MAASDTSPASPVISPMISLEDVTFSYRGGEEVFRGIQVGIRSGRMYLIQGPSGSGKSTLLRLINRLEEPDSGKILFQGQPLDTYPPPELRRRVMYIQQRPTVLDANVRDNLCLPFSFRHNRHLPCPGDDRLRELLDDFLLDKVPLGDHAQTLSVGQQQRLCLIRGLLLEPEVLLLDEPTSALDEESARVVEKAAEDFIDTDRAVLFITHRKTDQGQLNNMNVPLSILKVADGRVEEIS